MEFRKLDDAGLVWERGGATGPGLHALLIGVGRYPHASNPVPDRAGYRQPDLNGPATTAAAVADFLFERRDRLAAPLHSLRLVASPTPVDMEDRPSLAGLLPATWGNIRRAARAWRESVAECPDGAAVFYFSGHGIQRSEGDALLLPEDFLDPDALVLERTIDSNDLYNAMAPSKKAPRMSLRQFYFIDSCRVSLPALDEEIKTKTVQPILETYIGEGAERVAPKLFAATPGHQAFSRRAGGLTLFGEDLLDCLRNDAGESVRVDGAKKWVVTVGSLINAMSRRKDAWNKAILPAYKRYLHPANPTELGVPLLGLDGPPKVKCRFRVAPAAALAHAEITCRRGADVVEGFPLFPVDPHPHECVLETGEYVIHAVRRSSDAAAGAPRACTDRDRFTLLPPEFEHEFVLP